MAGCSGKRQRDAGFMLDDKDMTEQVLDVLQPLQKEIKKTEKKVCDMLHDRRGVAGGARHHLSEMGMLQELQDRDFDAVQPKWKKDVNYTTNLRLLEPSLSDAHKSIQDAVGIGNEMVSGIEGLHRAQKDKIALQDRKIREAVPDSESDDDLRGLRRVLEMKESMG